jgi:hypothetical protein
LSRRQPAVLDALQQGRPDLVVQRHRAVAMYRLRQLVGDHT